MKTLSEQMAEGQKQIDKLVAERSVKAGHSRQSDVGEYRGPGKWTTSIASGLVAGSVAATIANIPSHYRTVKVAEAFVGRGMQADEAMQLLRSVKPSLTSQIAAVAALIGGAVWGWNKASTARSDHEQLASENAELKQKLNWVERVAKGEEPGKDVGRG